MTAFVAGVLVRGCEHQAAAERPDASMCWSELDQCKEALGACVEQAKKK